MTKQEPHSPPTHTTRLISPVYTSKLCRRRGGERNPAISQPPLQVSPEMAHPLLGDSSTHPGQESPELETAGGQKSAGDMQYKHALFFLSCSFNICTLNTINTCTSPPDLWYARVSHGPRHMG